MTPVIYVYFFFKAEKSNSLVLTDCVNVFVYVLRLAGILNLGKNAGESSIFLFFVCDWFPSPEVTCDRWVGKCSIMGSSSSFLTSHSCHFEGFVFNIV